MRLDGDAHPKENADDELRALVERVGVRFAGLQRTAVVRNRVRDQLAEDNRGSHCPEGFQGRHQRMLLATGLRVRRRAAADD